MVKQTTIESFHVRDAHLISKIIVAIFYGQAKVYAEENNEVSAIFLWYDKQSLKGWAGDYGRRT